MKKVLLILGVVLLGLTSCKKEEIEQNQTVDNCYFGEAKYTNSSIFGHLHADFILSCGDTLDLIIFNPEYTNGIDDHISNIDGDTTYWRIVELDFIDSNSPEYFYDGNNAFSNGDSIMFIRTNGKYINCNTWPN
jgi:hypothetical protein